MVQISNIFLLLAGIVDAQSFGDFPNIGTPDEALTIIKSESRSNQKYKYAIPSLDRLEGSTLFHQYFNSYTIKEEERISSENEWQDWNGHKDGVLIQIENGSSVFFSNDEIFTYGKTDFNVPLGPLPHLENDISDQFVGNHSNLKIYAVEQLQMMASDGSVDALRMLADIYTFGFYDISIDINKAIEYYSLISQLSSDDKSQQHAQFMLGVIYSTGLFGKVEKDVSKALIHYQFAADMGSIQAQMVLAHKYMMGINVAEDLNLAVYYFSMVKDKIETFLSGFFEEVDTKAGKQKELIYPYNLDKFNIRWNDILGGLYGESISQAHDTVRYFETFKDYDQIKRINMAPGEEDETYETGDDEIIDAYSLLYFAAQKNYHGDYLNARDYDKAFRYANLCVQNGILEPGIGEVFSGASKTGGSNYQGWGFEVSFENHAPVDIFIGRCAQYLGHMYLRGEGTEQDFEKAKLYIDFSRKLIPTSGALFKYDLGIIELYGLGKEADVDKSIAIFDNCWQYSSCRYYKAITKLQKSGNLDNKKPDIVDQDVFNLLVSSSQQFMLSNRKLLQLYEQGDISANIDVMAGHYNSYVKLFDFLYFDFKIPFYAMINAEVDDITSNNMWTALVGMAVASELGYENAQSSLGTILYPTIGKFSSRKYRSNPEWKSKIYTPKRLEESIFYLEQSALHYNRDSLNFLGDIYYSGLYANGENSQDDPLWNKPWWQYLLPLSGEHSQNGMFLRIMSSAYNSWIVLKLRLLKFFSFVKKVDKTDDINFPIIPRDFSKAVAYYHKASSLGSHLGSYNVGWAYEYGIGVAQDLHLAKRYYDLSLARSNVGYIPIKIAIIRIKVKAFIWNLIDLDGRGIKELGSERNTWAERISMVKNWLKNEEN